MKKILVDTSGWYGFMRKEDPSHATIKKIIHEWAARLVTTNFVLDETLTLVRARAGHALAVHAGDALRDPSLVELLRVLPEDEENAWSLFVKHKDQDFSYTDCTSFSVMRRLGLETVLSTDHHFQQAGFHREP